MQSGVTNQSPRLRQALPAARQSGLSLPRRQRLPLPAGKRRTAASGRLALSALPKAVTLGLGAEALVRAGLRPLFAEGPPGAHTPREPVSKARDLSLHERVHISKQI